MQIHNPATVWPVPEQYRDIYSHAVETGSADVRRLHVSGQVGVAPAGTVAEDFDGQCVQAMDNVELILAAAAMSMPDVVRLTYYVVRRSDLPALNALRLKRWPGVKPAVTTLMVAGLVRPEFLVEIDVCAERPQDSRPNSF